jgi:hypothetical protein
MGAAIETPRVAALWMGLSASRGLPTEALVADVVVSKYAWHLPLYRQSQMMAAEGIDIDRSTLAHWVGFAAFELRPVSGWLVRRLQAAHRPQARGRSARARQLLGFRRQFYDIAKGGNAPIATQALQRIAALYCVEDEIRGRTPINAAPSARSEQGRSSTGWNAGSSSNSPSSRRARPSPMRSATA